jgi:hypothetical protein
MGRERRKGHHDTIKPDAPLFGQHPRSNTLLCQYPNINPSAERHSFHPIPYQFLQPSSIPSIGPTSDFLLPLFLPYQFEYKNHVRNPTSVSLSKNFPFIRLSTIS